MFALSPWIDVSLYGLAPVRRERPAGAVSRDIHTRNNQHSGISTSFSLVKALGMSHIMMIDMLLFLTD